MASLTVRSTADLEEVVRESGAEIGVLAVPAEAAQENYDALADAGIKGVLNFAPVRVKRRAGRAAQERGPADQSGGAGVFSAVRPEDGRGGPP